MDVVEIQPERELQQSNQKQSCLAATNSNKVNQECDKVALSKPSKAAAIRLKWTSFVEATTLHGLLYVFTGRSFARRILWALLLLVEIVWFSFQSFKIMTKYFSYPLTTKTTLEYEVTPEFPALENQL